MRSKKTQPNWDRLCTGCKCELTSIKPSWALHHKNYFKRKAQTCNLCVFVQTQVDNVNLFDTTGKTHLLLLWNVLYFGSWSKSFVSAWWPLSHLFMQYTDWLWAFNNLLSNRYSVLPTPELRDWIIHVTALLRMVWINIHGVKLPFPCSPPWYSASLVQRVLLIFLFIPFKHWKFIATKTL
jgi:hypothetical protein